MFELNSSVFKIRTQNQLQVAMIFLFSKFVLNIVKYDLIWFFKTPTNHNISNLLNIAYSKI